ncbi:MAG: COR domain-containing protein [Planctomycetaceae bacterium]
MAKKKSISDAAYAIAEERIHRCLRDGRILLDLRGLKLTSLPPEIGKLNALKTLYLAGNQLTAIPPGIGKLNSLVGLDLSYNQLTTLPPEIRKLKDLTRLFLHGNPALGIPDSILGPTVDEVYASANKAQVRPSDILNFYFAQRKGAKAGTLRAVNELKVMLVGRGGAGKTSLRRFFMGQPHNTKETETPGIALDRFTLPTAQGDVTVRLWDFAGQEITHALHQFFLTEGCIYILVLDPRSDTEMQDAEYWLGLLNRYSKDAPVLVALNRQDARQGGYDIDRRALKERFPSLHSFTPTNCDQRVGCEDLKQRLREAIQSLPNTELPRLQVPQTWLDVMHACAKKAEAKCQHLTLQQFQEICTQQDETEPEQQEFLARLLHKLGAVLHFVDEPRLRDTAVLDPHWVTDGVYRLMRYKDGPGSDGTLTLAEALKALPGETEQDARYFLRLMERFEMCFPLDEEDAKQPTKWLIPGALEKFQPEGVTSEWQNPAAVRLRYVYDPLPEGVIPRFIVMTHLLSGGGKPRWRNGVVLEEGEARALVRRGEKRNHVEVTALGPEADRLRLLEIIQGTFDRIHADLPNPKPFAEMELPSAPGVYRSIADLEAAESSRFTVAFDTPQGKVEAEPTKLLNQTSEQEARSPDRIPLKAFLSYSHKDKNAKTIFQSNLTVMTKKKLIEPWHDGLIEPGTLWKEQINQSLETMEVFLGLLTTEFLASDFIETVELEAAHAKRKKQGNDFLFFLIMVDDVSLVELEQLSQYQILKPGGKAISQYKSRREGFDVAQKELEQWILKLQEEKRRSGPTLHDKTAY